MSLLSINTPPIIAIEGTSGVGKTSLLNALSMSGHGTVKEYVVYARGHGNFPPFVPKNESELESNMRFFLDLESKRAVDITAMVDKHGYCFVDRSPYTFVAIQHAMRSEYQDAYVNTGLVSRIFQEEVDNGLILMPTHMLLLGMPYKTIMERMASRQNVARLFANEDAISRMYKAYGRVAEAYPERCMRIDNLGNLSNLVEAAAALLERIISGIYGMMRIDLNDHKI